MAFISETKLTTKLQPNSNYKVINIFYSEHFILWNTFKFHLFCNRLPAGNKPNPRRSWNLERSKRDQSLWYHYSDNLLGARSPQLDTHFCWSEQEFFLILLLSCISYLPTCPNSVPCCQTPRKIQQERNTRICFWSHRNQQLFWGSNPNYDDLFSRLERNISASMVHRLRNRKHR